MPNRSIYIRVEDLDLWEALTDKSEKVSQLLNKLSTRAIKSVEPSMVATSSHPGIERGCCIEPKPCIHWLLNGDKGEWANTLSGRVKDME